jgi:hypothetical protein
MTVEVSGRPAAMRWPAGQGTVSFRASDQPLSLLPNFATTSALPAAIAGAFEAWSLPPLVALRFEGMIGRTRYALDDLNLITFADSAENREITANSWAVTLPWTVRRGGQVQLWETDVVFNPRWPFATDGGAKGGDVQGILTHELGHAIGLGHSALACATMYGGGTAAGDTLQRTLAEDDLSGMRALYAGAAGDGRGAIAARVATTDGAPVFGAHVVAVSTGGIARVGAVTDRGGGVTLAGLPPGDYQLWVEPLVGHMTPDRLASDYHAPARPTFRATFAGGATPAVLHVAAGATLRPEPIRVTPQPPALQCRYFLWSRDWKIWRPAQAAQVRPGERLYFAVYGPGIDRAKASGFAASGGDVAVDAARVEWGSAPEHDPPYAVLPLSIRPEAPPGARMLYVTADGETAAYPGVIEVLTR